MDWTDLSKERDKWQALVNIAMDIQIPQNVGNFLTSIETISFSRRILLHEVT
jgi:hypothetical protein